MEKNNTFIPENSVELCGKITNVFSNPKMTAFTVSCGYRGMKKNENGRYEWNSVTVVFYEKEGLYYASKFKKGDRVIVNCVAQTIRDHYNLSSYTAFWGLSMEEESGACIARYDYNHVKLTGKITSASARENGWVTAYILTRLEKERPDVQNQGRMITDTYKSITPVRIYAGKNAAEKAVKEMLTKGTWVTLNGHVYGRFFDRDQENRRRRSKAEYIIAEDIRVIGQVQGTESADETLEEVPETETPVMD